MANVTLDQLPDKVGTINDAGILHLRESGVDKKVTVSAFLSKIAGQYQNFINAFLNSTDKAAARAAIDIARRTAVNNVNYTILVTDKVVSQNGSISAARTFTLPSAALYPAGEELTIQDESGTITNSSKITVSRSGSDTIDGVTSYDIIYAYGFLKLISDGTSKWTIVGVGSILSNSTPSKNLLLNASFAIDQINGGASTAINDDNYCFDIWNILTQTAEVNVSRQTSQEVDQATNIRITQIQASAQRFGISQMLISKNSQNLRSQILSFFARVRISNSQALRYAILEWTGSADSITSDVVNDWNSASYTAGGFFLGSNLNVLGVGSMTPSANTWTTLNSLAAAAGANGNNIIVMVWTEGTAVQNVTLDIGKVKLEKGSLSTPFSPKSYEEDLFDCQFYVDDNSGVATAAVNSCSGIASSAFNIQGSSAKFSREMFFSPITTIYQANSAEANAVRFSTSVTHSFTPSVIGTGPKCIEYITATGTPFSNGGVYQFGYRALARL